MKKFILSLSALLSLAAGAQTVSVADVETLPGETVTATLNFTAPADTYEGLYFEMQFPVTGFATTGNTNGWAGLVQVGSMNEGLVKITTADSKAFTNVALQVEFTVDNTVAVGVYEVKVANIQFMNDIDKVSVSDVTFNVNVSNRITLDENATEAPAAATGVNVRVKRTINAGEWSTICLPFAMTEEQVTAAFGSDVKLGDFTGYATEEDDDANIVGITVNFKAVSAIEANHPYVIKTGKDITEFTLDGVDIDAEEEPTVAAVKRTRKQWSEMIGTNNAKTVTEMENCLFLSGGKFWYAKGDKEFKAFRGYFDFYDVITSVEEAGARISISFDGTATGIEDNMVMKGDGRYYNLRGQHVEHPSKGVYITNGKKVVVK